MYTLYRGQNKMCNIQAALNIFKFFSLSKFYMISPSIHKFFRGSQKEYFLGID